MVFETGHWLIAFTIKRWRRPSIEQTVYRYFVRPGGWRDVEVMIGPFYICFSGNLDADHKAFLSLLCERWRPQNMDDKQRAMILISHPSALGIKTLRNIVNRNQNAPPLGDADGSLSEEQWTLLRDATNAYEAFMRASRNFLVASHKGTIE